MRGLIGAIAIAIAGHGTIAAAQTKLTLPQVIEKAGPSVVLVSVEFISVQTGRVEEEKGSGFLINDVGYAITAAHVVSTDGRGICPPPDQCRRKITGRIGSTAEAEVELEVMQEEKATDVALLRFKDVPSAARGRFILIGKPLAVAQGSKLFVLGFPLNLNLNGREGELTSKMGPQGRWITTVATNRGDSGGPVLDESGNVVAIVGGGFKETPNINYVIPYYQSGTGIMLLPTGATSDNDTVRQEAMARVKARLDKALQDISTMNSAKGAMMQALVSYKASPRRETWTIVLDEMRQTQKFVKEAKSAVVLYNGAADSLGDDGKVNFDKLNGLMNNRLALLNTYVLQPSPEAEQNLPTPETVEELQKQHLELINDIRRELSDIRSHLK